MPGISGFVSKIWHDEDAAVLRRMHQGLSHEPFDSRGTLVSEPAKLGVAWTSHLGGPSRREPLWNTSKTICLILVGEDFSGSNGADAPPGTQMVGRDDRSHILTLYEKSGADFIAQLNGSFSGVLLDLTAGKALLFNDRYGHSRIYYHESAERFYFSSEASALLQVLPALRRLDPTGLGEWFTCNCVLQNRTLFPGIFLLPPGSAWDISRVGEIKRRAYFTPTAWEEQAELDASAFYDQLRATFPVLLKRYLRGPDPIAMSMTGGLDGRMIMAWARRAPGTLPCYTFNGPYNDCADLKIGRRIAAACQQPHHTIQMDDGFFQSFPALAARAVRLSDGEMDVTGAVELHVNQRARAFAPVRLTGNYGSETIRSNVAFGPEALPRFLPNGEIARSMETAAETYRAERQVDRLSFIAFKQVPWYHHARFSIEQSQLTLRSPFLDNDLMRLLFQAPKPLRTAEGPSLRLIAEGDPELARIPTDRGLVQPPIRMVTPLRRRLSEFRTKVEYAFDYGMPQSFARVVNPALPRGVERLFLGYQKFYHFRTWYQHELAPYIQDTLLDPAAHTRSWYQKGAVEQMVKSHVAGRGNFTTEIHKVLSMELLSRQLSLPEA